MRTIVASLLCLWLPCSGFAEQAATDVVEVVASHLPDNGIASEPDFALDRAEIEVRQPATSIDLLRGIPGVDVSQLGGAGGLSFVSIRGGDPNFTLVLIDGVRVNDPTDSRGGGFDFSSLDPDSIERIEVYAGSLSNVLGSDALGGVINIHTLGHNTTPGTTARLRYGGSDLRSARVSNRGTLADGWSTSIDAGYTDSDGLIEGDQLRRRDLRAGIGYDRGGATRFNLSSSVTSGRAAGFPEDSGGPDLAVIRQSEVRDFDRVTVGFNAEHELDADHRLLVRSSWARFENRYDHPGIAPGTLSGVPPFVSDSEYRRAELYASLIHDEGDGLEWSFGITGIDERGGSDDVFDFGAPVATSYRLQRTTIGIFAETAVQPTPDIGFSASVRHDRPDSTGSRTVFGLAAALQLAPTDGELQLSWRQGFKLPSFFALGSPLVGNPDLNPELSESTALSLKQPVFGNRGLAVVTLFRSEYRDLIDFDPMLFTNINRGVVTSQGVEFALGFAANRQFDVDLSFTYDDVDTSDPIPGLRRRPEYKGSLALTWTPAAGTSLRPLLIYNGAFWDSSVPTGYQRMPAYWRLDLAGSHILDDGVRLAFGVTNLLDDDYRESVGFPNGGRYGFLALELTHH